MLRRKIANHSSEKSRATILEIHISEASVVVLALFERSVYMQMVQGKNWVFDCRRTRRKKIHIPQLAREPVQAGHGSEACSQLARLQGRPLEQSSVGAQTATNLLLCFCFSFLFGWRPRCQTQARTTNTRAQKL